MAAITIQLSTTNALSKEPDGRINLNTVAGGMEFTDEAAFRNWIITCVADPHSGAATDAALALMAGHLLAKDPLLDSPSVWNGKTVTLDVEQAVAANVFKVV